MKRILIAMLACLATAPGSADGAAGTADAAAPVRSRAYQGHENQTCCASFVRVYPKAAGARLDNCVLCHKGGALAGGEQAPRVNACDYCHQLHRQNRSLADSLNRYGRAYASAGAAEPAIRQIADLDRDRKSVV